MVLVDDLLERLRRVKMLRFQSRTHSATGWEGAGTGAVWVSEPAAGVVVFAESGTWQPSVADRPAVQFENVFRWSAVETGLRLEHLRFGPDHPVLLFEMAPAESEMWREVSPHLCRDDCYRASLAVEKEQIVVEWTIMGPQRREEIRYSYT